MKTNPTQQELNIRFAKALGWTEILEGNRGQLCGRNHPDNVWGTEIPNYFAPENFHLVRAAVGDLDMHKQEELFAALLYPQNLYGFQPEYYAKQGLLSPVEHIITAYLKVKEQP
jgi:hypothetical protein